MCTTHPPKPDTTSSSIYNLVKCHNTLMIGRAQLLLDRTFLTSDIKSIHVSSQHKACTLSVGLEHTTHHTLTPILLPFSSLLLGYMCE